MKTDNNLRQPPRGWKAWIWRAPIWLYRWHLGWALGKRFMLLTHIGRKSGLPRQAVIEVIGREAGIYYAASGFGEKAQWYKNIIRTPQVKIQIGTRQFSAQAERLPLSEAKQILGKYAQAHPAALRELSRLMGLSYDGSQEDLEKITAALPIIAFHVQ